jgi:hypothetical protein
VIRYNQVTRDLSLLTDFIDQYENEILDAKKECSIYGNIEKNLRDLPGITEHRFSQLQEIEAVLNYLNLELRKIKKKHFKKYLESYARALTSRDAEKYADAEDEVINYEILVNEVALLRNRFLGVIKGLDSKQWQLGHITKLRTAGLEDATI